MNKAATDPCGSLSKYFRFHILPLNSPEIRTALTKAPQTIVQYLMWDLFKLIESNLVKLNTIFSQALLSILLFLSAYFDIYYRQQRHVIVSFLHSCQYLQPIKTKFFYFETTRVHPRDASFITIINIINNNINNIINKHF